MTLGKVVGRGVGGLLLTLMFLAAGWMAAGAGFDSLRELRQLERTPQSLVAALLPGEAHVRGFVESGDRLLTAPESGVETVYYRHHVERRTRDSEGRSRWNTVRDERRAVPFKLDDGSGSIRVVPHDRVDIRPQRHLQRRDGDMRYTEYRIDPGATVFIFGYVSGAAGEEQLEFATPGQYTALISTADEASARSGMAGMALLLMGAGLAAASFSVLAFVWALRIHRAVVYLTLVGLVLALGQFQLAAATARSDLSAAFERMQRDLTAGSAWVHRRLADHGVAWDGDWGQLGSFDDAIYAHIPEFQRQTLAHMRDRLATQVQRTETIAYQFPERWLAPGLNLANLPPELSDPGAAAGRGATDTRIPALAGGAVMVAGLLLSLGLSYTGFRRIRTKRLIEDLPTSASAGVAYGQTELAGRAEPIADQEPLRGPLTATPCVWYRYLEEERRGSGKNARWVTLQDRRSEQRFLLRDDEGVFPVDPVGAEVIVTDCTVRREGRIRRSEWLFRPEAEVYALGTAEIDPETESTLLLRRGPSDTPFILTDYDESSLQLRKAQAGFVYLNLSLNSGTALGLASIGTFGALHGAGFFAAALIPIAYAISMLAALMYNGLVRSRLRVERGWANIQVSLKKRADLLPRLSSVLAGYTDHERQLQQNITALRALTRHAEPDVAIAGQMVGIEQALLGQLGGLVEAYPELKADQLARALMRQIVVLENEVALMRTGYNDCVERYNIRRLHVPEIIFTWLFRFQPAEPFRVEVDVHAVPDLHL
ncbi:MAG: LemA family protein, partial [Gammaproteobacteria bacterium]|nr:LemA family protein [Gammaproteobacteria bacterium]